MLNGSRNAHDRHGWRIGTGLRNGRAWLTIGWLYLWCDRNSSCPGSIKWKIMNSDPNASFEPELRHSITCVSVTLIYFLNLFVCLSVYLRRSMEKIKEALDIENCLISRFNICQQWGIRRSPYHTEECPSSGWTSTRQAVSMRLSWESSLSSPRLLFSCYPVTLILLHCYNNIGYQHYICHESRSRSCESWIAYNMLSDKLWFSH